ncbi:MAG: outer membrane protein assembly factor [Chitinophagaceae bacterium]|nr:outer membrane protein assembly factor [Chitinophagaceae bacterium]
MKYKISMRLTLQIFTLLILLTGTKVAFAQIGIKSKKEKTKFLNTSNEYTLAAITVSGSKYLDEELLISISGLSQGDKIKLPNDPKIAKAIQNLWKQNLFSNIEINIDRIQEDKIFLDIHITERPRLSKFNFKGIKDNDAKELKDKVGLVKSRVVTEATKQNASEKIKKFYVEKGYTNVKVDILERPDTSLLNTVILTLIVDKGQKVKINQINIFGNEHASILKLKKQMKGSKEMARISLYSANRESVFGENKNNFIGYLKGKGFLSVSKTAQLIEPYVRYSIFSASKFSEKKYEEDKLALVEYYNSIGYRDAGIEADTLYHAKNGHLNIDVKLSEGQRYYFGELDWKGNTKYTADELNKIVGIKKGDVYNQELLNQRIGKIPTQDGDDVGSLYLDDGYLAFNTDVAEKSINGDTINFEIRITEGEQYTLRNINIAGNDKTHEHVIRRELRTLPGNKFSRADIIRSQREIANLGFFDAEKIGIQPQPHNDGTVDIDYTVTEKSADQLELQAGFGGGLGITGTIGVSFNNFALKNIGKLKEWDPLPMGDGQKLSLRGQANGKWYNSVNFSFTEPWLGGKKPNSFSINLYRTYFAGNFGSNVTGHMTTLGAGATLSKRLKWPDDNFVLSYGLNYQLYNINDYTFFSDFNNGVANNLSLKINLGRYSIDQPLYPRSGSNISLSIQFTAPYSIFSDKNYENISAAEKYKWIEYHKYRFTAEWYQRIKGNLILKLATKHGYLGYYNPNLQSPFERFQVGGDGLSGFTVYGRDIIAHRGYEVYTNTAGATIFNKYTAEIRYPFSLNPSSTIYGLAFYEAANAWDNFKSFNPFQLKRSAGLGIRIFLPMFGLLGLDYGLGFDRLTPGTKFGQATKFSFMLGFEPE